LIGGLIGSFVRVLLGVVIGIPLGGILTAAIGLLLGVIVGGALGAFIGQQILGGLERWREPSSERFLDSRLA